MKTLFVYSCSIIICFWASKVSAQNNSTVQEGGIMSIDKMIEKKKKDKKQMKLLIKFQKQYTSEDRIDVEEFKDYYKITVDHPVNEGYTGGAECYKLDKKTGETEMIWHEHPMPR